MPEVFRENGFVAVIYLTDHEPPHVHLFKAGEQVKVAIGIPGIELPSELERKNMSVANRRDALALVIRHQVRCHEKWRSIHGPLES